MNDLLIPLSEVPGLDPVGLRISLVGWEWYGDPLVTSYGSQDVTVWSVPETHPRAQPRGLPFGRLPHDEISLSLSLAATRDRLLRWLAGRVGLEVGCGAPRFQVDQFGDWWVLVGSDSDEDVYVFDGDDYPALADLDPTDDTRLPDGSRRVDALALRAVAQHVGGDK